MKSVYFRLILCTLLSAQAVSMQSQTPFENLVEQIAQNSPALKALEAGGKAETSKAKAENRLDDPEVEFEHLWPEKQESKRWSVGVTQTFSWPGLYGSRSKANEALAKEMEARYKAQYRTSKLQISQTLARLILAKKRVNMLCKVHSAICDLKKRTDTAWQHGETTILDVNKSTIEQANTASDLQLAVSERDNLYSELLALGYTCPQTQASKPLYTDECIIAIRALPDELETMSIPPVELADENTYMEAALRSPDIKLAEARIVAAEKAAEVAKISRTPGFSLGYRHVFEGGNHFNGLAVGMSLPVWNRRSEREAALAATLAARFEAQAAQTAATTSTRAAYANALRLQSQIAKLAPALENSDNFNLLEKAYNGGQLSMLEYLTETAYFLKARLALLDLHEQYFSAASQLNSLL